jgi:hypothetical protein
MKISASFSFVKPTRSRPGWGSRRAPKNANEIAR